MQLVADSSVTLLADFKKPGSTWGISVVEFGGLPSLEAQHTVSALVDGTLESR